MYLLLLLSCVSWNLWKPNSVHSLKLSGKPNIWHLTHKEFSSLVKTRLLKLKRLQTITSLMQFNAILFDHCILMSSMTSFTEDIPATFNKHFYYMDPSKSSGKLCMHIPARWGSWTVRAPFKAWAAFISVSCLTFLCLIMNEELVLYRVLYTGKQPLQKCLISLLPHWWLVKFRQGCKKSMTF